MLEPGQVYYLAGLQYRRPDPRPRFLTNVPWSSTGSHSIVRCPPPDEDCQGIRPRRRFRRGDCNGSGRIDISDAISSLGYLFLGNFVPRCLDACDIADDGALDISDPIHLLGWIFAGNMPPPAPPGPNCGVDPTPDDRLGDCGQTTCE